MQILAQETNIFGPHFLEASAGTGKTFAIEHLFVRLLLEGEKPLKIEEILVVTFTKAAAAELKERLRRALEEALGQIKNKNPETWPYLKPFFENSAYAEMLLEEALALFDLASIFTIHGFCYRALKRFSLEARLDLNSEASPKTYGFLKARALDYFYYVLKAEDYSPSQLNLLIRKSGFSGSFGSLEGLIDRLIRSLAKAKSAGGSVPAGRFQAFCSDVNRKLGSFALTAEAVSFEREVETLIPFYKKSGFDLPRIQKEIKTAFRLAVNRSASLEEIDQLGEGPLLFLEFFQQENQKKKTDLDRKAFTFFTFYDFFDQELKPLFQTAFSFKVLFQNLLDDLNAYLSFHLKEEELLVEDDLLNQMLAALQNSEFKTRLQNFYQAAVIDEFQDTDQRQWQIFSALFLKHPDLKAFYLVGDPKQSIYAFRLSDLYTYFEAKECFGRESWFHLETNYRSNGRLIGALNYLFSKTFLPDWLRLPKLNLSVPYREIKSSGKPADPELVFCRQSPCHFWLTQEEKPEKLLFPKLAQELRKLKEKLSLDEIAILVKDRFQAESLRSFLEENHLPANCRSQRQLKESKAVLPFYELLFTLRSPQEALILKRVLLGKYFQLSPEALTDASLGFFTELFAEWKELLKTRGLAVFLNRFYHFTIPFASSKQTVLTLMIKDLAFYKESLQLFDFLLAETETKDLETLLDFLEKLPLLEGQDDPRLFLKTQNSPAVQIMTMHMSKGLEFPVVFALGLMERTPCSDEEGQAEKLRQLYVVLTRASQKLYIPLYLDPKARKVEPGTEAPL
ncbi:MAG: UvrD-helicase domain-containing protein [Parachlamydiales bacterium]|jgi:exodeoxyribonuclease V beta subunit